MKKLSILILLMSVVIFAQSCKKKTEEPAPTSAETHLLKTWKQSELKDDDPTTINEGINPELRYTFTNANGQRTLTVTDTGISVKGTWTLTDSKLQIEASLGGVTLKQTWTITSITDQELKYTITETNSSGKTITSTITMVPA